MERDTEAPSQPTNRLAQRISQAAEQGQRVFSDIGRTLGRTAASGYELLSDGELRRKGRLLIVHEAQKGIKEFQQKVGNAAGNLGRSIQQGAGTLQRGIASGPRQLQVRALPRRGFQSAAAQVALERVKQRVHEARYTLLLEEHKNCTVDVQIAEKLYEEAPQEIRTRLWVALTLHPELPPISLLQENDVLVTPQKSEEKEDLGRRDAGCDGDWEMVENPFGVQRKESTPAAPSSSCEGLLEKMSQVPWPLETEISEDGNYAVLIQITIGQDEVDEIIRRDMHRTFPELPHYNLAGKQASLFNLLKAYSLHDLEVGYCQGMGFVAGVLLLYLPEEWAFRTFCLLMSERQTNLRRLYVPGLTPLKVELWTLEWLLEKHLPILSLHLKENCVTPVLYASQWFLTAFACPFDAFFAARILDCLMQEKSTVVVLRTAFAILVRLGEDLLRLDNFEDILTHIKVRPLSWDVGAKREVLSASLKFPITKEDLQQAEQSYQETETTGSDVPPEEELPATSDDARLRRHDSNTSDLQMMMSMNLLLDVDAPEAGPELQEKSQI